ncbi:MAG: hypothetical protein NTZ50_02145 [Chloroflexi bacterium]|nr:hypothetical protein [Chloroflexota bacterium]
MTNSRTRSASRSAALAAALLFTTACSSLPSAQLQRQQGALPSPVAWVTAAPLPQAQPTPSLAPLPTVTSPPATAIPKKEAQDSSAAIGLWNASVQSSAAFTGYLDVAAGPGAAEYRDQNNSRLLVLAQQNVAIGFAATITDVAGSNPEYVLFDKKKRVARSASGDPLLDIRTTAVQTIVADSVAQTAAAADGVILPDLGDGLVRDSNAPIYTGTKGFTSSQQRDAAETLLRTVRARVPDKVLIIGGYGWHDGSAFKDEYDDAVAISALADGVLIDEFVRTPISDTHLEARHRNAVRTIEGQPHHAAHHTHRFWNRTRARATVARLFHCIVSARQKRRAHLLSVRHWFVRMERRPDSFRTARCSH